MSHHDDLSKYEQEFEHFPESATNPFDAQKENREELLKVSSGILLRDLPFARNILITTTPTDNVFSPGRMLLSLQPYGGQDVVPKGESVRAFVKETNLPNMTRGTYYNIDGASIDGYMPQKGVVRRNCNLMLTPIIMRELSTTPYADESNDTIRTYVEKGVLEYHDGFYFYPDVNNPAIETPEVASVALATEPTPDMRIKLEEIVPWLSPLALESHSD